MEPFKEARALPKPAKGQSALGTPLVNGNASGVSPAKSRQGDGGPLALFKLALFKALTTPLHVPKGLNG